MKKKLTKEQIEKRKNIKVNLFKLLHIISYVLSLLFIITCIVAGVNSCSSSKDKTNKFIKRDNYIQNVLASNNVQIDNYSVYESLFSDNGLHSVSVTLQQSLTSGIDLSLLYTDGTVSNDYRENYYPSNSYILYNGELSQITRIQIRFSTYTYSNSETRVAYRLNSINIFAPANIVYASKDDSAAGDYYAYDNTYYITSLTSGYSTQFIFDDGDVNPLLNTFFIKQTKQSFTFRYDLNYYWWVGNQSNDKIEDRVDIVYNSVFLDNSWYYKNIDLPYFAIDNVLYNQISLVYWNLNVDGGSDTDLYWAINGQPSTLVRSNGYGYFAYMQYRNTITNDYINVLGRDSVTLTDSQGNPHTYNTNTCSWVGDKYRFITFYGPLEDNAENTNQLNALNTYSYNTNYNGDILDVFDLLKTTFSSLMPFLNLAILPNFTIAMLLTIPLAVTAIIIIIRLVKK